jgi:hypothetical protein
MSVIRPDLEYSCPIWHSGLTAEQSDILKPLQKRVLRLFCNQFSNGSYEILCADLSISTLADRREMLICLFLVKFSTHILLFLISSLKNGMMLYWDVSELHSPIPFHLHILTNLKTHFYYIPLTTFRNSSNLIVHFLIALLLTCTLYAIY